MQPEFEMEISAEIEAAARTLSRHNVEFLRFVRENPECLQRATFAGVDSVSSVTGYPVQAWPTFVRRGTLRELAQLNVALCRLVKAVPRKVFGGDVEKLGQFYRLEAEHARIVTAALGNPEWTGGALARSDFFHTSQGFKCLEFNVAGNLGGWQASHWADAMSQIPPIARFLERSGIELRCTDVVRALISFLLGQALRKFRSPEINIGFLTDIPMTHLMTAAEEHFRQILGALGGVEGTLVSCDVPDLVERDGCLYVGDTRIHALVDGLSGSAGLDAHKCWLRGSVSLYNGALAPVLTDKRNLALLVELVDSDLFEADEKATIRSAVPWTRHVSTVPVHPAAAAPVTPAELIVKREQLVLKPGLGRAGEDVYLGASTPEDEWAEAVGRAFDDGTWVVQERVESVPHLYQSGEVGCAPHDVVWSFFVFGETFGGTYLRMAPKRQGGPVNAARGSADSWVLEVEDATGEERT